MPLFTYECKKHGEFEAVLRVSECDNPVNCPICNKKAKKIISLGHGGIWRKSDSVPWVRSVAKVLTDNERPNPNINTVDDLKQYYKEHPNIRPKESHPAFPSSYGDAMDAGKIDKKQKMVERSRKASEYLRNLRRIEINSSHGSL